MDSTGQSGDGPPFGTNVVPFESLRYSFLPNVNPVEPMDYSVEADAHSVESIHRSFVPNVDSFEPTGVRSPEQVRVRTVLDARQPGTGRGTVMPVFRKTWSPAANRSIRRVSLATGWVVVPARPRSGWSSGVLARALFDGRVVSRFANMQMPARPARLPARTLPLAVVLSLLAADSHAQTTESSGAEALAIVAWTPVAALGLVTDTAIGIDLVADGGRVPRTWAIVGTVAWGVATACWAPVVGIALDSGNYPNSSGAQQEAIAIASVGGAITLGSLGLSIYALLHPTDATSGSVHAANQRPFTLAPPLVTPTPGGASAVLQASF